VIKHNQLSLSGRCRSDLQLSSNEGTVVCQLLKERNISSADTMGKDTGTPEGWGPMKMFGWAKKSDKEPCKTEACLIQECLSKNSFDHSKCTKQIEKLKACCENCQVL